MVERAGLKSWRVTTLHVDHTEAKSGVNGSGGETLRAVFGLAMRDKHRVVAGDFNQAHHYIAEVLDHLIATKAEYEGITYQKKVRTVRSCRLCSQFQLKTSEASLAFSLVRWQLLGPGEQQERCVFNKPAGN